MREKTGLRGKWYLWEGRRLRAIDGVVFLVFKGGTGNVALMLMIPFETFCRYQ